MFLFLLQGKVKLFTCLLECGKGLVQYYSSMHAQVEYQYEILSSKDVDKLLLATKFARLYF